MAVALAGVMALPSLARKKKVQPAKQQTVWVDSLSPNDRKRFEYFFTEAARQHAAGNLAAAFDLFEHARKIDPRAAEVYFYQSLYYTQLKKDSLALECMNKAIALNPDNLTYVERLAQYYIGMGQYDKAIGSYEALYAKNHSNTDALRILAQLYLQQKNYRMMLNTVGRL